MKLQSQLLVLFQKKGNWAISKRLTYLIFFTQTIDL
jgi:hypothetical protein